MYIQITNACNHSCPHCCFSCTSEGEYMDFETFKNAVHFWEGSISIGGGEPTTHPLFERFLLYSIGICDYVWLATNGSMKETSVALANLAKMGVIGCALSQDEWHNEIDPAVVRAFTKDERVESYNSSKKDQREIRTTEDPIQAGRCDWGTRIECPCETLFVKPNGDVHWCGCENALLLGNVNEPDSLMDAMALHEYHEDTSCWNEVRVNK